ncbi:MAG TPA: NUDIX hydrolase [Tepidisphaeraceae bacterium]|nr:NUDIX hydrolase [Tepidisphaeraceae bacterium]
MPGDLPFDLLVTGHWRPEQVRATWAEDSRPHIDEVEQAIEQAWSAANAQKGKKLFDGPMCRLEKLTSTPEVLQLTLSPTSYRIFFGTNLSNPGLADRFGKPALANATGLSAGLMTSDGFLMLGRRNKSVAYYPGRVHPFAGSLEPKDAGDVFAAMQRELAEELSIKPDEIRDIHCAAIAEDRSIRHPELIFPVFLGLTREQVEARLDAAEHETCRAIPLKAIDLEGAIGDGELTPIAAATVWLVSKQLDSTQ